MDFSLCQYKHIFGKPNEGLHKYRVFDIAVVDVVTLIATAYGVSYYLKEDFKIILLILFLLGIISHRLFCVRSTIDKLLFK
jgi:hypothetical protein